MQGMRAVVDDDAGDEVAVGLGLQSAQAFEVLGLHRGRNLDFDANELAQRVVFRDGQSRGIVQRAVAHAPRQLAHRLVFPLWRGPLPSPTLIMRAYNS